ncbi:hypothetical protein L1987_32713 [Smallanthus sonchifolius]|uniref:Uncharacterized protein n=1 Tax=Smallanthus sonchifolius TaxID=185202 RepID=A0ACB9HQD4_9ASTR|nr:hypothetical protein L1987_32713 [Smallanthus sonchifolius]
MTLEDFFTSTELKDGLTTPTRVNELLNVMQNEKENIVKNASDATRQWSAVATAIAATENKECLDLFIQLDGLKFIDKWLKDAQKLMNDSGDGFLDELITALLLGLERLPVDHDRSVGSGIGLTVQGLLGHSSLVVQQKAKDLCDRWAQVDGAPTDVSSIAISPGGNNNVENVDQSVFSDTVQQETDKEERLTQDIIMESETFKDVKENQENDCLTTLSGPSEQKTLTSDIDVDHGLESATKTETMEDIGKDEEMVDGGESQSPDHGNTTTVVDTASGVGDSASSGGGLQESPDADNPKTTSDTESDEADEDEKQDVGIESEDDSGGPSRFSRRSMKGQDDDLISKRPSDMELDYGMVDPLELARQVANEVELEVDSQEQSSSTSTDEKEHHSTGGLSKEVSYGPGPGPGPSPKGSPSRAGPDIPATQINETGQESGLNPEKGISGFDLNQEVSSDETETDHPVDQILTPISVVSASRAAAVDGLPVAPLQFEGTLGWKGSAATSAFRRIPEGEKTYSPSSSHNNSNQRLNLLDFDLNVAEGGDDKIQDFLSRDKFEESSRLPLDLNSLGDCGAGNISLDWKRDGRVASLRQNGSQDFDLNLNDRLTIQNNASFNNPFLGKQVTNKRDESVISIFGTQVEVNRKDYVPPPPQPTNGRLLEPSMDFSLGRPGSGLGLGSSTPYANLPAYGYGHNGYTMGPMYGPPGAPIPYMVDSRGAPIIPPMPPIPPAFSQPTQPFFFNMAASGAPSGSNGAGPSRNSLDLNPGTRQRLGIFPDELQASTTTLAIETHSKSFKDEQTDPLKVFQG